MSKGSERIRQHLRVIIFGTHTFGGRAFDVFLLVAILFSVLLVVLESVSEIRVLYGRWLRIAEWMVTGLFTIEYVVRIWISDERKSYVTGFFGIVDLLAILPTYLSLLFPGTQVLAMIRVFRLTRVFRILNLFDYVHEARLLLMALFASRHRLMVFMLAVLAIVSVFGTIAYLVESPEAGFTSIPRSIYWAIVTLTTVGYGDIAPQTALGQVLASMIMILGYSIIAIPTGIVSVEMARQSLGKEDNIVCEGCGQTEHLPRAKFCQGCGRSLRDPSRAKQVDGPIFR